jgi:hypothetical protein
LVPAHSAIVAEVPSWPIASSAIALCLSSGVAVQR